MKKVDSKKKTSKKAVKKDVKKKMVKKMVKDSVAKRIGEIGFGGKGMSARDAIMMRTMQNNMMPQPIHALNPALAKKDGAEKDIENMRIKMELLEKKASDDRTKQSDMKAEYERKMKEAKEEHERLMEANKELKKAESEHKKGLTRDAQHQKIVDKTQQLREESADLVTEEEMLRAKANLAQAMWDSDMIKTSHEALKVKLKSNIAYAEAERIKKEKEIIETQNKELESIIGSEEFKNSNAHYKEIIAAKLLEDEKRKRYEMLMEAKRINDMETARNLALKDFSESKEAKKDLGVIEAAIRAEQENKFKIDLENKKYQYGGIELEEKQKHLGELKRENVRAGLRTKEQEAESMYHYMGHTESHYDTDIKNTREDLIRQNAKYEQLKEINENKKKKAELENETEWLKNMNAVDEDPEVKELMEQNKELVKGIATEKAKQEHLKDKETYQQRLRREQLENLDGIGKYEYFKSEGAILQDLELQNMAKEAAKQRMENKRYEDWVKQKEVLQRLNAETSLISEQITKGMSGDEQYEYMRTAEDNLIKEKGERLDLIKSIHNLIQTNPGLLDVVRRQYSDFANLDESFVNWDIYRLRQLHSVVVDVQARGPPSTEEMLDNVYE